VKVGEREEESVKRVVDRSLDLKHALMKNALIHTDPLKEDSFFLLRKDTEMGARGEEHLFSATRADSSSASTQHTRVEAKEKGK
jgi:hypothetical protein